MKNIYFCLKLLDSSEIFDFLDGWFLKKIRSLYKGNQIQPFWEDFFKKRYLDMAKLGFFCLKMPKNA
jgi:hypothetical protein